MIHLPVLKASERKFQADPDKAPKEDIREELFQLEREGELEVIRVPEPYMEVKTKYGRIKKIPVEKTWHHKSCGQCGHIPGYSTSIFWLNRQFGLDYHDPTDQTSCTAWNYYASATSNPEAQAAVAIRNFASAAEVGYFPLIHCGTSFGHYKEVRHALVHQPELRRKVRKIMEKLGKKLVIPEEIVHYSEWVMAMKDRIAERQVVDMSNITATVHPACHYHKLIEEDAIYDSEIYGAQRSAIITGTLQALGVNVGDYSTWYDCCGFGFRHILVSRDFSRSFSVQRKIEVMKEEVNPDIVVTHDTGCVTTLDQSQFAGKAHDKKVGIPVISDSQMAALAMGAHPYKVLQMHWHNTDNTAFLAKLGFDVDKIWAEFEAETDKIRRGEKEFLSWEDADK
ncbi:MAG: heterodisulfide reductase-related iron-sulfur binding cluster [Cyclobacteriaceae bacterium]|nr:heterodisulfide reductase-related iron-sulfur binding cluster [Cyclobacteriaceae bacterium]